MRYRFAVLSLTAVFGVLPALTTTHAVPAPKRPKMPEIYALVYVGLGKNDPDNPKRIAAALQDLPGFGLGPFLDPKVKALPIIQDKEMKLSWIERDKWVRSKTRAANVEGTAVVRVWFTEGSPQEQALIVNAIAHRYVENQREIFRDALPELEKHKANFKKRQEDAGAKYTEEDEKEFRRQEEAIKHLPHVLEWASLPEKP